MFGLILFTVLYALFALALGAILFIALKVVVVLQKRNSIQVSSIFYAPFKLTPYFIIAILINGFVCEGLRNVDAPLTDYWTIPVDNNLILGAIDAPDNWSLWPSRNGGEAIVSNVNSIYFDKDSIYGQFNNTEYFSYRSNDVFKLEYLSFVELSERLTLEGKSIDSLKHPIDIYHDKRSFGDLISLLIILCYPIYSLSKQSIAILTVNGSE